MKEPENKLYSRPFEDEASAFNAAEWLRKSVRYWYLFVVGLLVASCAIILYCKRWTPAYRVNGRMLINEAQIASNLSTISIDYGNSKTPKDVNNQLLMLTSYDFLGRIVDSLPKLSIEYYSEGRFKRKMLYGTECPIELKASKIEKTAYTEEFIVEQASENELKIANRAGTFEQTVRCGEMFIMPYFSGVMTKRSNIEKPLALVFKKRNTLISELYSKIKIKTVIDNSTIIDISFVNPSISRGYEVINTLLKLAQLQNIERKNKIADGSIDFINEQLDILSKRLHHNEKLLSNYQSTNNLIDPNAYGSTLTQRLTQYEQEEVAVRLKHDYLDYLSGYLMQSIDSGTVASPSSLGVYDAVLTSQVQKLNELLISRSELSKNNIYYVKYTQDIDNTKKTISEVIKTMKNTVTLEQQSVDKNILMLQNELKALPAKERHIASIQRDYRVDDTYYTFFLQRRAEVEIQRAGNISDHQVIEQAHVVSVTNKNSKWLVALLWLLAGVMVPFLCVVILEKINNKFRDEEDLKEYLADYQHLVSLTHLKEPDPILVQNKPRAAYSEILRIIRDRVAFWLKRKEKMVLTITSTHSGDGKTLFSTNLATLYAMTNKKTLLVDMDLRKPNVHAVLGMPKQVGLTNYLIGDCGLNETIISDERYLFDFIQVGALPPNPGDLIRSDEMLQFIEKVRSLYDYVIIDTSPIGMVPDASFVVENTDLTLFVIRQKRTDRRFCCSVLQQLKERYVEKIKIIFSDVDKQGRSKYGYGNYGTRSEQSWWKKKINTLMGRDYLNDSATYYTDDE